MMMMMMMSGAINVLGGEKKKGVWGLVVALFWFLFWG